MSAKLGTNTRNSKKSKGQQVSVMWLRFLRWHWLNRDLKNKTWACTPPGLIYAGVFSFVESSRTTWSPPFSSLAYSWASRGARSGAGKGGRPCSPHPPLSHHPVIPLRPQWPAETAWLPEGVVKNRLLLWGPCPKAARFPPPLDKHPFPNPSPSS